MSSYFGSNFSVVALDPIFPCKVQDAGEKSPLSGGGGARVTLFIGVVTLDVDAPVVALDLISCSKALCLICLPAARSLSSKFRNIRSLSASGGAKPFVWKRSTYFNQ